MKRKRGRRRAGTSSDYQRQSLAGADSTQLNEQLKEQKADLVAGGAAMREQIAALVAAAERVPARMKVSLKPASGRREQAT